MDGTPEDIYDISPVGYFSTTPNGVFLKVNRTFVEMTGYKRNELLNKMSWTSLLTIGGKIFHETHYAPLLRMHGHVKEINFDIVKRDGNRIPVLVNSVLITDEQNNPVITHSSVLDITQRKQYEHELLKSKRKAEDLVMKLSTANAELQQFAYIVSHDLQAPLTAIKGYIQVLEYNKHDYNEKTAVVLKKILNGTERMSLLISDLLDYSRLEHTEAKSEEVDLNEVWQLVVDTFGDMIIRNQAQLIVPDLPSVKGNKTQLIRLFQNLLSNSLKYKSEKNPVVEISFSRMYDKINFSFKDNGIGFRQEEADKVFKFFHRLPTKGKQSGTGIGLAACRRIVELHGGEIWAKSEPGKGSVFYFTLSPS